MVVIDDGWQRKLRDTLYYESDEVIERAVTAVAALIKADRLESRALADEVSDALGDFERLPPDVAERMTALLHRLRTGREL